MTEFLRALAMTYGPTLLVCAIFYVWSRRTQIPWLARLLHVSSVVSAIFFAIIFAAIYTILQFCDGGVFQGVSNCAPLPDMVAQIILSLGFMGYAIAIFVALILVFAGGLVEALRPTPRR